ncbi:alpha-1,6-mannosyltransferase [Paucimonas lemoignei]|uniref:Alpha-1,6-mannosyltransferase n=2 Tax=Paucimonas lemoignei TaxID=29443 RepID=A0A4R3I405_PAULE|nr:alpha-1,6-mannosyltransferase [Paucimonas lemoignei]
MFYAAEGGGVSSYLNAKARWLARRGNIQHTILSPSIGRGKSNPVAMKIPSLPIPGICGYRMPRSIGSATRILRSLQPDLIEVGDAYHCAWAALRMRHKYRVPVVAFYHSDMPQVIGRRLGNVAQQASEKYLKYLYRQFDMVLAPSRIMTQQLHAIGVTEAIHQPLGVDTWMFRPQRRDPTLRAQLRLPPDTRLLVYAGRFAPEKNLHLLLEAVTKLGKRYHLVMIGSGDDMPRCRHATFIPFVRDLRLLAQLLASCDLLVHPGDSETFGLIVLEAMACGLPVLGVDAGGVAELVDENTGMLVKPRSAAALTEGIEAMFQKDMARMGANARQYVTREFDWDRIVPQLLQRYAGLLAGYPREELEADITYATERR